MADAGKLIANNKKAYHDYFIEEKYEAGISLHGTEVKSLRMGKCSIKVLYPHRKRGGIDLWYAHQPVRKGQYFQQRSAACEKTAASQKGNQQDAW